MTEHEDEYGIGKGIDEDYIDVETRRADVSPRVDSDDDIERTPEAAERVDMSHRFDVADGSGAASAIEELIDENAVIEHDGRASTRTFFYVAEAAERSKRQFERMIRLQEGEGDPQRDVENRAADRRRTVDGFCSQLDMSDYHKERVEHVVGGLNMSHMAHYSSPKVILAIISLIANEDDRFIRDEETFRDLMTDVGTSLDELKNIRELVRQKSERL